MNYRLLNFCSILIEKVAIERISYKDTMSYFVILFENSPVRWICRFYLNSSKKYIAFPTEDKKENKIQIESLNDIYKYKDNLIESLSKFL